jgi:rare lipoprotein A
MRIVVCICILLLALLYGNPTGADAAALHPPKIIQSGTARAILIQSKPETACQGELVVATWYAVGRRTASGEPFNPEAMTAAHCTLPLGSRVIVTNPRNGKSVTVTINDRGPSTKGITIDLARGAARAIDMSPRQSVCLSPITSQ